MRVANWNPKAYDFEIIGASMKRLKMAAEVVADKAREMVHTGTISRPVYKRGPYAGLPWTARAPGSLKKTIRVTDRPGVNNIWIMAGTKDVFYAKIHESKHKFLKPALQRSVSRIRSILANGR